MFFRILQSLYPLVVWEQLAWKQAWNSCWEQVRSCKSSDCWYRRRLWSCSSIWSQVHRDLAWNGAPHWRVTIRHSDAVAAEREQGPIQSAEFTQTSLHGIFKHIYWQDGREKKILQKSQHVTRRCTNISDLWILLLKLTQVASLKFVEFAEE